MDGLSRRGLLQSIFALVGAAVIPACGAPDSSSPFAGPEGLPPLTLALISAVAETTIPTTDTPGAIAAQVPANLEQLLANWASTETKSEILAALDAINAAARGSFGLDFEALPADDQTALLNAFDEANASEKGYAKLKELILRLYYFSETGASVELEYVHSPGAWQPSLPLTDADRNSGGP